MTTATMSMHFTARHPGIMFHGAVLTLTGNGFASSPERAERIARALAPESWPRDLRWRVEESLTELDERRSVWCVEVRFNTYG